MTPSLQVTYHPSPSAFLAPRLSADSNMSDTTISTSIALTPRSSVSSTGTCQVPSLALSSRSSSDALSPPIFPTELALTKRPSLKHMPSWRSFVSLRSRSTSSDISPSEEEDEDRFGDAMEESDRSSIGRAGLKLRIKGVSQSVKVISSRKLRPSSLNLFGKRPSSRGKAINPPRPSRIQIPSPNVAIFNENEVRRSNRVDTPLEIPLPLILNIPSAKHLEPLTEALESPEIEGNGNESLEAHVNLDVGSKSEEYFTPRQQATPKLPKFQSLPTRLARPRPRTLQSLGRLTQEKNLGKELPIFNLDIFSPRYDPPPPPTLRGILDDTLPDDPISPLGLPSPNINISPNYSSSILGVLSTATSAPSLTDYPTSILPRSTFGNPFGQSSFCSNPNLSTLYSPRSPKNRSPRPSLPHIAHSPTCPSQFSSSPKTAGNNTFPSRKVRRHSSLSIRPAILPCPTPPSLLVSPRQLGTPLLSPNGLSMCGCESVSSRRGSRKGSKVLGMSIVSGGLGERRFASLTGEIEGLGMKLEAVGREAEKVEGLAEKLKNQGVNPYFVGTAGP